MSFTQQNSHSKSKTNNTRTEIYLQENVSKHLTTYPKNFISHHFCSREAHTVHCSSTQKLYLYVHVYVSCSGTRIELVCVIVFVYVAALSPGRHQFRRPRRGQIDMSCPRCLTYSDSLLHYVKGKQVDRDIFQCQLFCSHHFWSVFLVDLQQQQYETNVCVFSRMFNPNCQNASYLLKISFIHNHIISHAIYQQNKR